jgi:hypothetical protein
MLFIDFACCFCPLDNFTKLLFDFVSISSFSSGGSFALLLLARNLGTRFYYFSSLSVSSLSKMIDFYDFTFFVFILKEALDSTSFAAKHTVFLLLYSNLDFGRRSFKKRSTLGHYIGSIRPILF